MKYAIIGDLHGTELSDLERALNFENPDFIICTGDFEKTTTIHQFKNLEEKYQKSGKIIIKVPGDYDYSILNNISIKFKTLNIEGKNISQLHEELIQDPIAKQYIDELVNSKNPKYTNNKVTIFIDEAKFDKEYKTLIIHGAYNGTYLTGCQKNIKDLCLHLVTIDDYLKNFIEMEKKGYKIMIRGHDHYPIYVYNDPKEGNVINSPETNGLTYSLLKVRKHIINPGGLFNRFFATIETENKKVPILKYHKL